MGEKRGLGLVSGIIFIIPMNWFALQEIKFFDLGFEAEILPPFVLGELYSKSLVVLENPMTGQEQPQPLPSPTNTSQVVISLPTAQPIKFLGNNSRKIVLLVKYPGEAFLPDEQLQFLTKILGACKLNLGDVAIINQAHFSIDFEVIQKELSPQQLLLFGIDPSAIRLPIQFPDFKPQSFNGCIFLKSPAAEHLNQENEEARNRKMQLWNALKQLFQL